MSRAAEQFAADMATHGLVPPEIVADGRIHRFSTNGKKGDTAGGYVLHGAGEFVEHAARADALLAPARLDGALVLFLLPRDCPGLSIERRGEISGGQFYRVSFAGAQARKGELLAEHASVVLELALDRARVALAARMVGAAQRAFDLTLRYLREREQFGQPLLRFQALNFRMAELLTRIDAARLLAYQAAWLVDQGQPFAQAALVAKIAASGIKSLDQDARRRLESASKRLQRSKRV